MRWVLIILLIVSIFSCDEVKNDKCSLAEMQNNFKVHTVCVDHSDGWDREYQITTEMSKNAGIDEDMEVIKGSSIILEYAEHFQVTNVTDITGGVELVLIIDKEASLLDGQIKTIPSSNIRGVGTLRGARAAWSFCSFDTIRGKFRILESTINSIQIEIIDSLYASIPTKIKEGCCGYSIKGVIRFKE